VGKGVVRRRLRTTADTALKSEEGGDLCAEARFLTLARVWVRQIEMRRGQVYFQVPSAPIS